MKSSMMFYNLLAVLLVGAVSGASNMVFKTIDVDMGSVGSDDDIRLKLCDKSKCCTTKVLSNTFSGEWVKNKKEKWDGSKLGNCSQILFDENLSSIEVSLLKDGKKTGPEVNSITLTGQIGSDKKKLKKYKCGSYRLSSRDNVKSNKCSLDTTRSSNSPTSTTSRPNRNQSPSSSGTPNMTFKKLDVQMGNVGSDDDMRVRICDNSKCCTTKELSHTFSSEWVAKKKETWDGSDMGNCSGILFDSKLSSIEVVVLKSGKKSAPEITNIVVTGQVGSNKASLQTYKCSSYKFSKTDSQKSSFCVSGNVSPKATTTSRPAPSQRTPAPSSSSKPSMTFKKLDVQMGNVGSDDDMRVRICDNSKCCTTKELSHTFSSEWVAKKKETWDGSDMGNCSGILFDSKLSSIEVVLLKSGKKSAPEIKSIIATGQVGSNKANLQTYKCGEYKFSKTDNQKSRFCITDSVPSSAPRTPTSTSSGNLFVNQVFVQVGDDGTDDDVSLEICNEKSALNCCDTGKLSRTFSNDWSKNDNETWENSKLGACKTASFDPCKGLDVSVKKKSGKDSLKVSKLTLDLNKPNEKSSTARFVCLNYNVGASDTIKRNTCILDKSSRPLSCPPRSPSSAPRTPTAAPRPSVVTKAPPRSPTRATSGPCLRSGKNCDSEETVSITSFEVEIGSDGSTNPITAMVCSDTGDVDVCCETPSLNKPGGVNWTKGKETWPLATLGRCAGENFPTEARTTVTNLNEASLLLTLNKKGSDNLQIQEFYINTENGRGVKRRFKCGRFSVNKEKVSKECYAQYPKATATTKRPTSNTTTRPPFRSGSG